MKTKSFLLFSTSVFATSIFLIVFHSQQPQSIQNIVTQTHQHIKDFKDRLQEVEQTQLVQDERFLSQLGLAGPLEPWHNASLPALVSYARADQHAAAVAFVRDAQRLPLTLLLYNLGLTQHSLAIVSNYCNSSKCVIVDLDLSIYPSHVSDDSIHAYRPLIIQHALARVRGVVFAELQWRWAGAERELAALWARAAAPGRGLLAWPRRAAVTSLTHPRMFHYFAARLDDFLFVPMVDATRLLVASGPGVDEIMRPWIQCALTQDCIMPLGAQSGGCRFDKKPQYRYSGCHGHDASALSIVLGLRFGFEEAHYTHRGARALWRRVAEAAARDAFLRLQRNGTEPDYTPRAAAAAAAETLGPRDTA